LKQKGNANTQLRPLPTRHYLKRSHLKRILFLTEQISSALSGQFNSMIVTFTWVCFLQ